MKTLNAGSERFGYDRCDKVELLMTWQITWHNMTTLTMVVERSDRWWSRGVTDAGYEAIWFFASNPRQTLRRLRIPHKDRWEHENRKYIDFNSSEDTISWQRVYSYIMAADHPNCCFAQILSKNILTGRNITCSCWSTNDIWLELG